MRTHPKNKIRFLNNNPFFKFFSIILLFSVIGCGSAQVKKTQPAKKKGWTESLGVASVSNNEIGRAKDDALMDAKRNAVKQVLGTILSSRTDIQDGEFVSSKIEAKTQGFIETFKILHSKQVSKYEYQVKILAKVNAAKIEKTIGDIIANMGKPRLMVILQENFIGKKSLSSSTTAGNELESIFSKKGFPMVDKSVVEKLLKKEKRKIRALLGGSDAKAKEIGVDAGAEVIIVGISNVKKSVKLAGTNMISMQADVEVKAIEVNTGKILSAESGHGAYPHINPRSGGIEAIKKAVRKLSKPMINTIVSKWDPNRAQTIVVLVTGLGYSGIKKLTSELLSSIRGVKAVNRKGTAGKAAKIEVEFLGSSFDFADRISEANLSFRFKIGEVKMNKVNLRASKK